MSQELTIIDDFDKGLRDLQAIETACLMLAKNPAYRKFGPDGIAQVMARAKALKIDPFQALNTGFYCVAGRIGMTTEMMAALVRRAGHSIVKDSNSTPECVILHGKRADNGDTWTSKFDKQDAIVAGLWGSQVWKKYPETMLYNRAMSTLFRQLFPDLSLGAGYCENELQEIAKDPATLAPSSDVEVMPDEPKIEPVDLISDDQAEFLQSLLIKLPQKSQDGFLNVLAARNIDGVKNIPLSVYPGLLAKVNKTFEEMEKKAEPTKELPF